MRKQFKTKKQLMDELSLMQERIAELENVEAHHNQAAHSTHQIAARLNAVIQAFEGLIYVCSRDYIIEFMNERLIERTGHDATGELCYRVLHDRDSICPWCVNDRVFAGETVRWEVKSPKDNRWYYVANTPIYNEDGTISKHAMIQDITDRKLVERALLTRSEEKYRELVENANSIILRLDSAGNVTFFNEFAQRFFGYSKDEILGRNVVGTITPEVESTGRDLRRMIQDIGLNPDRYVNNVNENMRRTGERVWIAWTNKPIFDDSGQVEEILCIGNDISDRKHLAEELQKSEATQQSILLAAPIGIGIVSNRILGWTNEQITNMTGYSSKELFGQSARMLYESDEEFERVGRIKHAKIKEIGTGAIETRWRRKDGSVADIYLSSSQIDPNDFSAGLVFTAMDLTDRKHAEKALQKSEKYFKAITENSSDILLIVDKKGTITYASLSVERLLGYKQEELIGKSGFDFILPVDLPRAIYDFGKAVLTKKTVIPNAFRIRHKDGSERVLEGVGNNLLDNPSVAGFVMNVRDVTERKRTEEALRYSEERFSKAFNMSPYPTTISTIHTGLFIDANDSFLRMLDYTRDEIIGYTSSELSIWTSWNDRKYLGEKIIEQAFLRGELIHLVTKAGEIRDLLLSSEIITLNGEQFVLSIFYDITEQKKLEAQLRRAEKIQAIGTLAGGIAHDFNNILSAIMGYTDMALTEHNVDNDLRRYLEQIFKAGKRARDLVRQILAFSRQSDEKPHPLRISPIIKEVLKLLRASLPSTITIHQNIQSEPDIVLADPTHIHQILMNLCTNAAYALREKKGALTVNLRPVEIRTDDVLIGQDLSPGMYLKLTVSDTGCGIDPVIKDRIFDPFFTTKKPGEGTGMGLSVVHGIVKSYGGAIIVESEVGKGTDFSVYIPLLADMEANQDEQADVHIPGGKECILFVDDEEVIIQIGKVMLTSLGYDFVGTTDSLEALNLFRAQSERFDLVITDMTMPNMTGVELARELMCIRPDIPIILCTGFSEAITPERAKAIGLKNFILKPIIMSQIATAIRHALDHKE